MISFHSIDVAMPDCIDTVRLGKWISDIISQHERRAGDILFVFCTDAKLLEINKKHLQHDYFTDVITFNLSINPDIIRAEIYISLDRVVENANEFMKTIDNEIHRVLIHGILHLLGYSDHSEEDRLTMRIKEDECLSLLH
jgi:rRNA maturation RNase YbeY